ENTVIAIGMNGEGVLKDNGIIVFVPFALVGEKIRYKVLKVASGYAYAKAEEILTPAEERVRPKCPIFGKCGGCQLQHIRYASQLKIKEDNIANCFKKIAFTEVCVKPTVRGDDEFRYRNKLQLPVSVDKQGKTVIGFYAENSHRVVPVSDCPINAVWTADVISAFGEYFELSGLNGYNETTHTGYIREIAVKDVKGKLIITVVSTLKSLPDKDKLISILKGKVKYPFSLYLNVNETHSNVIYGDKYIHIYGSKDFAADMLGIRYRVGVQSFMQVNDCVCAKLYSTVCALVSADENTTVIDAYSGAGLMTALLAKRAKKAIGIEIVPEAVNLANLLAKQNGLEDKISNYQGKCEEILPDIIEREKREGNKTVIVLDPPRKGCDIKVINAVKESKADKIIYVSCKPSTLARDVGLIIGTLDYNGSEIVKAENPHGDYVIDSVRPFDMFAQTKHIETVCALTRTE
ncbi:MAG: 23S rRNA (uracil(1939)-C(5))-methyltransferase RlmD, partial [Clostridia bacterium]|nr:23S rRNA (uracil(1939)-C(5))-methyltransferase RlmD [Clostridia bacterium]